MEQLDKCQRTVVYLTDSVRSLSCVDTDRGFNLGGYGIPNEESYLVLIGAYTKLPVVSILDQQDVLRHLSFLLHHQLIKSLEDKGV